MTRLHLALLLAISSASVEAQPVSSTVPIQPTVDSAQSRQAFRNLSVCLAELRPRWARRMLEQPYLSDDQARIASYALGGHDNCTPGSEAEFTFRTSSMVASVAEYFLTSEMGRIEFTRLESALATVTPLNASEDFALCVAARNPTAARDLAFSELGSAAETEAARRLAGDLAPCINQGQRLPVDVQALRALTSTALYRGVRTILTAEN